MKRAAHQNDGPSDPADEQAAREWLARLRTGDEGAFEAMFRAYAAPLCDFAFSYVRVRETAEEIVQDLYCWIWEQRFTLEMAHGVRAWLFTAVRNRSLNALAAIAALALSGCVARTPTNVTTSTIVVHRC